MFRTMGERASERNSDNLGPGDQIAAQIRRSVKLGLDLPLLLIVLTLIIIGLIMVYSASYDYSFNWYGDSFQIFQRQLLWLALGGGAALFLTFLDYHRLGRWAVIGMGVTLVSLVVVLFANQVRNNAVRTLSGGSVQPSELAKLVTIIYLAIWLYSKRDQLGNLSFGLVPLGAILGITGGLILLQPDLSAAMTVIFLGGMMFFLAGGDLRQIGLLVIIAVLFGWIIVYINPTGSARMADYLTGLKDPTLASYHVRRALEAFVKGQWFGVGIGKGVVKVTGLPVPQTDSIFAVVGEETGVLGAVGVAALYVFLLWRGLTIARRANDGLGMLLAAGLSMWIATEAFINMAVIVNLVPFAGNALPFISSGGSNLVVSLAAVGILLNISRQSIAAREESERNYSAVVDLRRGDGRRHLSRPRRPGSVE